MTQAHPSAPTSTLINSACSADLAIAVQVACRMLDIYSTVDFRNSGDAAQAHGALTESLRILLRALDVEPDPKARVAELHRLCAADYTDAAPHREQDRRDDAHLVAPDVEAEAAVRRSVGAQFPAVAALLADERGAQ